MVCGVRTCRRCFLEDRGKSIIKTTMRDETLERAVSMPGCSEGSNSSRSTARLSRSSKSSSSPDLKPNNLSSLSTHSISPSHSHHDSVHSEIRVPITENVVRKDSSVRPSKYNLQCCTLPVCLVTLQILLGFTIIVFGGTMLNMTSSLKSRDAPYWAGILLFLAGCVGLYFSATRRVAFSGSIKAFILKASFVFLSVVCIFVNTIASAFCGIQGSNIVALIIADSCEPKEDADCRCTRIEEGLTRMYTFHGVIETDCMSVLLNLRTYLFFQCTLNAVGGFSSFFVVILMWRDRYQDFHSGLRFYSYSATLPSGYNWSPRQGNQTYANQVIAVTETPPPEPSNDNAGCEAT
ncbi:sarcospan-like [Amphiura filiformis]|uniref:sarcospan-like n=1 Tax=Amphiura filiformis TaxID=82378 RepID=UPI003B214EBC